MKQRSASNQRSWNKQRSASNQRYCLFLIIACLFFFLALSEYLQAATRSKSLSVSSPTIHSKKCMVGNTTRYDRAIRKAVERHWPMKYKKDWCDLKKQLFVESNLRINVCSPVGACGIAQFMPATAKQFRIDPYDPFESIDAAARYMAWFYKQFRAPRPDQCRKRLSRASYNAGLGNVLNWQRKSGMAPCWQDRIEKYAYVETKNYVFRIEHAPVTTK